MFDQWKSRIGILLGPLLFCLVEIFPFSSLSSPAHHLAAVMGWVMVYWLTEAIPLPATALLGVLLASLLKVAAPKEVLAPFADPIVFLFLGSFILAEALKKQGLTRRFALMILSLPAVAKSRRHVLLATGVITAVISLWISNSATTVIMLPIVLGLVAAVDKENSEGMPKPFVTALLLMTAYSASIGGMGTPVGSPPNLIGIGFIENLTGTKISFEQWMGLTLPIVLVMTVILSLLLLKLLPSSPGPKKEAPLSPKTLGGSGRLSRGEINTLIAFGCAVTLWILPTGLEEGMVALIAALLLFILPVDFKRGEATLTWQEASRIDWGTLLLFGGGLSLGKMMFATGLAEVLGEGLLHLTGATTLWGITACAIGFAILVSETTSNTASANMVIPMMIAFAQAAGVNPLPPALGACLGSSMGFMLPVSTPPNALVYGTGKVPLGMMIKTGIAFDLAGFAVIWTGLRILCPIMFSLIP